MSTRWCPIYTHSPASWFWKPDWSWWRNPVWCDTPGLVTMFCFLVAGRDMLSSGGERRAPGLWTEKLRGWRRCPWENRIWIWAWARAGQWVTGEGRFRGRRDRSWGAGWSQHSLNLVVPIFPVSFFFFSFRSCKLHECKEVVLSMQMLFRTLALYLCW